MKNIAERRSERDQNFLFFHSLHFLVRYSNSEMLSWPNSPLLVLVQFFDSNVLSGGDENAPLQEGGNRVPPLHFLAELIAPSNYSTHVNQLILAKQLIEHGANVNAVTIPLGETLLHNACHSGIVTSLDFIELLLETGADPNAQDYQGLTPLMNSAPHAPGAAKFLLNWSATDVTTIISRSGVSFLARVRRVVKYFFDKIALPDNSDRVQHQHLLQQWRGIEEMLVNRGPS
jgi:hypothetical protein